jgi:hypothetical protein
MVRNKKHQGWVSLMFRSYFLAAFLGAGFIDFFAAAFLTAFLGAAFFAAFFAVFFTADFLTAAFLAVAMD